VANAFAEQLKKTFTPTNEPEFHEPIKETIENVAKVVLKTPANGHQLAQPATATAHEVMTILKDIRGRGAPGADKITNKALKHLPESLRRRENSTMFQMPKGRSHSSTMHQPNDMPQMWRRSRPQKLLSRAQMC
jgi:hypothetical protein